ncbi:MAG: betaine--homocysteine S-methyltransferase [Chloroflexi bacterium]|nr:betaine--homocysteine S-methyltransferase [Chloroflexota bacterium]
MNPLQALLDEYPYVLADGAMGTMLMNAGLEHGESPERWNVEHPDRVRAVHEAYINAGSQIVLTNTFGGSPFRLKLHKLDDRVAELNRAGAEIARNAADAAGRRVVVAGSMGPSGELIEPRGTRSVEEARDGFAQQAAALEAGGVDVLWIETMSDLQEVRAAVEGARQASSLPIVVTMTFDTRGFTMMGVSPAAAVDALQEMGLVAFGGNCGNGPAEIEGVIKAMHERNPEAVLVAKSNAGIPEMIGGEISYSGTPAVMAEHAVRIVELGARIIGACCGSTPEHIRAMREALEAAPAHR